MNGYVDFHSMLLPGFKGGSMDDKVIAQNVNALNMAKIKTVVTTSIFNYEEDSVDEFLKLRQESYELLKEKTKGLSLPKIILSAEVCFSEKLLKMHDMNKLCIGDTNYMMISFNPKDYSPKLLELLEKFIIAHNVHPIVAHLESYLPTLTIDNLKELTNMGILTEISCSYIVNRATRKTALELINSNIVQIIGSNNNDVPSGNRSISNIAIDILNKDINTNLSDIAKQSPQYSDAVRIMRYNLPFGKYKHIKNNAGMIISNASLNDVLGTT
jgi:tyrosine-protein phosphatase YwqE